MKINFISPQALWLLMLLPIIVLLMSLNEKRIKTRLTALGTLNISNYYPRRSLTFRLLPIIPIILILLAIARPYLGSETLHLPGSGGDIMLVIDISRSMLAKDMKSTSRMEFVKRKVLDLTDFIKKNIPGERLGIVLFAGESYLFCPLTEDYAVLRHYMKSVAPDLITSGGSAIFDGVNTAIKSLKEVKASHPRILMMSDGEDSSINIESIIALSKEHKIPIDLIGIGTIDGAPIELSDGSFVKDKKGEIVFSKLNEASLQKIALSSYGQYIRATLTDYDLEQIFKDRKSIHSSQSDKKREITVYNEIGKYLLLIALLIILVLSYFGQKEILLYTLLYILILRPNLVYAGDLTPNPTPIKNNLLTLNEAYHAFQNGNYEAALETFQQHTTLNPDDKDVRHAYASTLYKLGRYAEAKSLYDSLSKQAVTGREIYSSEYDLGNTNFMLQDYKEAIKNFEKALSVKAGDDKASKNLTLAKKRLEETKKNTPTPTPTSQVTPTPQQTRQASPTPEATPSSAGTTSPQPSQENEDKNGGDNEQATPTPADNSAKEEPEKDNPSEEESQEDSKPEKERASAKEEESQITEREAKSWLDSLSDQPILLRRQVGRSKKNQEQAW